LKIAVAGGSGFIGRYICKALQTDGHDVVVLGRDPDKTRRIPQLHGAEARRADVTDPESLRGVLEGAEAVVFSISFPNYPMEQPRKGLTFDRYERGGVANVLAECDRANVGRFLYISGAGAHPTSDKTWYRAKGRAEEAIKAAGIEYCVIRPSWAYGPEDRALNRFVQIARLSPVIPRPKVGPQLIRPVFVEDVGEAVRLAFATEDAWGRVMEIGGPEVLTMNQVIHTMLKVLGKRRLIVPVPVPLLKLATAPLVVLPRPPMSPSGIEFATQDGLVDPTELMELLELEPVSLRVGLARYLS
jgi:uncharacterized protein YbjT (DUF2867 family)